MGCKYFGKGCTERTRRMLVNARISEIYGGTQVTIDEEGMYKMLLKQETTRCVLKSPPCPIYVAKETSGYRYISDEQVIRKIVPQYCVW